MSAELTSRGPTCPHGTNLVSASIASEAVAARQREAGLKGYARRVVQIQLNNQRFGLILYTQSVAQPPTLMRKFGRFLGTDLGK